MRSRLVITQIHRFLASTPKWVVAILCLTVIGILGVVDRITGYEISFSVFYLMPIAVAAWYSSTNFALLACLVSATTWLYVDLSGGHAYSMKWIPFWNAFVRLGFFIIITSLLLVQKKHLENEKSLARKDPLTGVNNTRVFREWLSHYLSVCARHNDPLALGYVDLDNFKYINDTMGHSTGDQVLCSVASLMTSSLRSIDIVGRLGGDEFAILLPKTDHRRATMIFDRLHKDLLETMKKPRGQLGLVLE